MKSVVFPATGSLEFSSNETIIQFNKGQALLHLASMYPTMLEVLLELVQNAIDTDVQANQVWIKINYGTGFISVKDNGKGTSISHFNEALATVANQGRKGENSLGRFGIGNMSPLGKCQKWTFTSCPHPQVDMFTQWVFNSKDLIHSAENLRVPIVKMETLTSNRNQGGGRTHVEWRTEVAMHNISKDKLINSIPIDTLVGSIQDRFPAVMRRNNVRISIEIVHRDGSVEKRQNVSAPRFTGRPLPEIVLNSPVAGQITFRLFAVNASRRKQKPAPHVLFGMVGNDFRFPAHLFVRYAEELIGDDLSGALTGGLFEGEIVAERVTLQANRKAFAKNDALTDLIVHLSLWWDEHGSKYATEAREARQEQRLQDLGVRSMQVLEQLIKSGQNSPLVEALRYFKAAPQRASVGMPTQGVGDGVVQTSTSTSGTGAPPSGEGGTRSGGSRHDPRHSVQGPTGKPRVAAKSAQLGLQFVHESLDSPDLWKLDPNTATLIFNIRHPLWSLCDDKGDTAVMKLQEIIAIEALTLQTMSDSVRMAAREHHIRAMPSIVHWLLLGDRTRTSTNGTTSGG